jgi:hypothetical protein
MRVHDMRIPAFSPDRHYHRKKSVYNPDIESHTHLRSDWPDFTRSPCQDILTPVQKVVLHNLTLYHLHARSTHLLRANYSTPSQPPCPDLKKRDISDNGPSKRNPRIPPRIHEGGTGLLNSMLETCVHPAPQDQFLPLECFT